jgi:hypothetical protein
MIKDSLEEDVKIIAMFLSKFNLEKKALSFLGFKSLREAFKSISLSIGAKGSSIRLLMNEFDPAFDNGRKGFHKRNMTEDRKVILSKYNTYTFDELSVIVLDILKNHNKLLHKKEFISEMDFELIENCRKRNPQLTKNVLEKHGYKCINDANHMTFEAPSMINYVEGHHIMPMHLSDTFDFDLDVEENIVPLCPNCHRAIHLGVVDVKHKIIDKILDIQNLSSLKITKQDLYSVYL